MISDLSPESVLNRRQTASIVRLQALFYFVTALSSVGYVSYILAYYNTVVNASGLVKTALLLLAGSLFLEAIAEVPSGAFADRLGYGKALKWSFVLLFLHSAAYLAASFLLRGTSAGLHPLPLGLVSLGEVFLALGIALQNGALTSWFVISIKREGYRGELTSFMARKRFTTNVTWLIVGLFVSLILKAGPSPVPSAFIIGAASYLAAFVVTLKFIATSEEPHPSSPNSLAFFYKITKEEFYGALGEMMKYRKLLIVGMTHSVFWTLGVIQTYFWRQILNLDKPGGRFLPYLPVVWFLFALGQIIGNDVAARIKVHEVSNRDNRVIFFNVGQILMALSMLVIVNFGLDANASGIAFVLAAILLSASRLGRELSKPITMAWTHEEIRNDRYRATIDSLIEASAGFIIVLIVVPATILSQEEGTMTKAGNDLIRIVVTVLSCATVLVNIPVTWFAMRGQRTSPTQ